MDCGSTEQRNFRLGDMFNLDGDCILKESELIFVKLSVVAVKISFLLTSRSFFHRKLSEIFTMGSKLSKKNRLRVVDLIPQGREFSRLVASGEIVFKKDSDFNIPQVKININGYFPALVRFWPEGRGVENNTPNISVDSGIDFVP